ncbi:hypothetical protein M3Y94_00108100 [Aphelenchoides besseyi]|nr:hypothetical protein M3Y94_00108100 [Aphelenchoides besseyi]
MVRVHFPRAHQLVLYPDDDDGYSNSKVVIDLQQVEFNRRKRRPTVLEMERANKEKQRKMMLKKKRKKYLYSFAVGTGCAFTIYVMVVILALPLSLLDNIRDQGKVLCMNRLLHHQLEYYNTTDAINTTHTSIQCRWCNFLHRFARSSNSTTRSKTEYCVQMNNILPQEKTTNESCVTCSELVFNANVKQYGDYYCYSCCICFICGCHTWITLPFLLHIPFECNVHFLFCPMLFKRVAQEHLTT